MGIEQRELGTGRRVGAGAGAGVCAERVMLGRVSLLSFSPPSATGQKPPSLSRLGLHLLPTPQPPPLSPTQLADLCFLLVAAAGGSLAQLRHPRVGAADGGGAARRDDPELPATAHGRAQSSAEARNNVLHQPLRHAHHRSGSFFFLFFFFDTSAGFFYLLPFWGPEFSLIQSSSWWYMRGRDIRITRAALACCMRLPVGGRRGRCKICHGCFF